MTIYSGFAFSLSKLFAAFGVISIAYGIWRLRDRKNNLNQEKRTLLLCLILVGLTMIIIPPMGTWSNDQLTIAIKNDSSIKNQDSMIRLRLNHLPNEQEKLVNIERAKNLLKNLDAADEKNRKETKPDP
jgi:hypothetical protein